MFYGGKSDDANILKIALVNLTAPHTTHNVYSAAKKLQRLCISKRRTVSTTQYNSSISPIKNSAHQYFQYCFFWKYTEINGSKVSYSLSKNQ